ncbi:MAG: nodulation protein NfeD, partial [Actinomycetota bacterium]
MRKPLVALIAAALLVGPATAALAIARPAGPLVDVAEVSGVVDRPMANYIADRIGSAEKDKVDLLVFEMSSLDALKVNVSVLAQRISGSSVPVAMWAGPRGARVAGGGEALFFEAPIRAMTPSARIGALRANDALSRGAVGYVAPGLQDLFNQLNGRSVKTKNGIVTLNLPDKQTTVRFFQPGPIRRLLHAFANPSLVYLTLVAGALLLAFELFQPGFGVAGWTAALLFVGAGYGLTVLPARWPGMVAFFGGLVLLTLDVVRDAISVPTVLGAAGFVAGSSLMLPGGSDATRISPWLVGFASAATLIFFVPVMTWVRRARQKIPPEQRQALIGLRGQVRSILNPEGFVWVQDELWRARSEDGRKMGSGEPVEVASVDGAV